MGSPLWHRLTLCAGQRRFEKVMPIEQEKGDGGRKCLTPTDLMHAKGDGGRESLMFPDRCFHAKGDVGIPHPMLCYRCEQSTTTASNLYSTRIAKYVAYDRQRYPTSDVCWQMCEAQWKCGKPKCDDHWLMCQGQLDYSTMN